MAFESPSLRHFYKGIQNCGVYFYLVVVWLSLMAIAWVLSGGFDKSRLQNGVIEPLREAELIQQEITVCILAWIITFHAIAEVVPGTHNPIESDTLPENSCQDRPRPNTMPDDSCWRYRRHKGQPRIL